MGDSATAWDGNTVRKWLESRIQSSRFDQAAADRQGYVARDDYDKAAAVEWTWSALATDEGIGDQAAFGARIRRLIGANEYRAPGVHDDDRFERHVRTYLRKVAKLAKTNEGFVKTSRY